MLTAALAAAVLATGTPVYAQDTAAASAQETSTTSGTEVTESSQENTSSTSGAEGEISQTSQTIGSSENESDSSQDNTAESTEPVAAAASSADSSSESQPAAQELPHVDVLYCSHVQNIGWQGEASDGSVSGTQGQSLRMEAMKIRLSGQADLHVNYQVHVQNIGWQGEVADGASAGTEGQSLRLEALKIRLTGNDADQYSIYYRVHAQNIGWMGWARDGQTAGTTGQSLRLEAIQIQILPKTAAAPVNDVATAVAAYDASVSVQAHVQNIGWQDWTENTGGTTGRNLRMEALKIVLNGGQLSGGIQYRTHVQNIGWEGGWAADGSMSGTEGQSLRLEAIQIQLTGEISNYYDIYYRAHVQNYGWLGWAKNGESAGSSGCAYRMEALEIRLCPKAVGGAPGSTANAFVKDQIRLNVPCLMQYPELPTGCESVALTNALKYYDFSLGKSTIADRYLPYGSNYAVSFVGNPHTSNGAGVFPPGIVTAANRYLSAQGSSLRAYDITGSSMTQLYSYLDQGYPVLVWSTTGMASPHFTSWISYNGRSYPWYREEHCVVLKGYNHRTNVVYVSDSISGDISRNASAFTSLYNQIGRFAVVIR